MKKVLVVLLICIMCFCDVATVMAEELPASDNAGISDSQDAGKDSESVGRDGERENSQEDIDTQKDGDQGNVQESDGDEVEGGADAVKDAQAEPDVQSLQSSGDGTLVTNMPTGELLFVTLAENTDYRWNANDSAEKNSVIHLDDASGQNCNFRLQSVGSGYYGIKHIKSGGTDRYADIDDKSKDSGAKLHLWESSDDKVSGNDHRQFAFYYVGEDDYGNDLYHIRNKNSQKWMGYEDTDGNGKPSYGDKIIQTDSDHRKLWIITKEVVPKSGSEAEDMIAVKEGSTSGQREDGAYCEIFRDGTIESVNRDNDMAIVGTDIHFYEMGTSSKWLIKWNSKYSAYTIHAVTDGEKDRNNMVWDVDGESTSDNAKIHLWSEQSNDKNENTSQLWRFIRQSDGTYKIQNARSGKYVGYKSDGDLIQSSTGTKLVVDAFAGTDDPVNFNYSGDWMKNIPDNVYLSSVNIPGSHDTGTASITEDFLAELSFTSCQKYYYGEQLNIGTRSFDIRCNATKDDAKLSDVMIIHGSSMWQCYDRDDSKLTLQDILDDSVRFLKNHPSESIVMMVKPDDGSTEGLARAVGSFIENNKNYVWTGDGIPSMGEARGKIVFIRRYEIDTAEYDPADDGLEKSWFGIDLSDWDSHSYGDCKYAMNIYDEDGVSVYAQDAYNEYYLPKRDYVEGTMKQTVGSDSSHEIPQAAWIYNYTSCAVGRPLELTRGINPWLFEDKMGDDGKGYIDNRRLGMVMLNFIDGQMSRLIYETNYSGGDFYTVKATAPTEVEITYGQTLSEAKLGGQSGDGTWSFDDGNYIPTFEDYKNGETFRMTFKPSDKNLAEVTAEVSITEFVKKSVTAGVDDKEMIYGDGIPEFTYTFDKSQLVGSDTEADLGITMTVESAAGEDRLTPGTYEIKAESSSDLYDVKFEKSGELTVDKKTVGIQWSDTSNLEYTEAPVNVTATLTGVIAGDDCTAYVTGGNETGPSWDGDSGTPPEKYTATVEYLEGKDSDKYLLPDDNSIDYYIRRSGDDNFIFPDSAVVIYGHKLSQATLVGASGGGEFIFLNEDGTNAGDEVLDAGVYYYETIYIPEDVSTERPEIAVVRVEVQPKYVNVICEAKDKTYGEETPELTWHLLEGSGLVEGDTMEDLALTLTCGAGEDQFCDAGQYRIDKASCYSQNYDVSVSPSYLTVSKRVADIKWPDEREYEYSGNPVNVTAQVGNQARDNDCDIAVLGGVGIETGSYKAVAAMLSNGNYVFGEETEDRIFEYEIIKTDPEVTFPSSAAITYGQDLEQAELMGASGDGEFVFEEPGKLLTVDDSGSKYGVTFIPNDAKHYNIVKSPDKVPVTVEPKALKITADDQSKIYGHKTPQLTWRIDETQLVGEDNADGFDILLTAGEGDDDYCDVGGYDIGLGKIVKQNDNYKITVEDGTLKVDPLAAVIQWSSISDIKVGDEGPSAEVINLINGDDCTVTVESDGTSEASWTAGSSDLKVFSAEITGLSGDDSFNYTLPDDDLTLSYLVRRADAKDYNMPETAVMTYGQKLSEARMTMASGDGTFTFVDDSGRPIGDTTPDSAGQYKCRVKFTPADEQEKPVYGDMEVTVRPKAVTVNALPGQKTYGEQTELDFEVDESQLVQGDTKEDLALTLTAVSVSGEAENNGDDIKSPVGVYEIRMKECGNANYDVTVVTSWLYIRQKEVGLVWSDVSNLVYTGNPVNVTAALTGVLAEDDCTACVTGGNETGPSWTGDKDTPPVKYTATAVLSGDDSGNYRITGDDSIAYYIRRAAADDFVFPEKAVLTYGQKLSEARLIGGSGDGEFIFTDNGQDAGNTVLNAGSYQYGMIYKPNSDTEHAVAMDGKIQVEVQPKFVVAKAEAKNKIYGDRTPGLTYTFDESQLVGSDTVDDLGLTLTAGSGDGQFCDAGTYQISKASCTGENYQVTVIPAYLTVSKRIAEIKWPDESEYVYSGNAVNINAGVENQARAGDCSVAVLGGVGIDAGSYRAVAVLLSNSNYVFDEASENRIFEYEILKATPEVTFPSYAEITYGQTLEEAELTGAAGDGTFMFEDPGRLLTVADSGSKYSVTFIPKDTKNYNEVISSDEVPVTVNPKKVTLTWSDVSNLVYTGEPVSVTAVAGGLLTGDTCDVKVVNGDRIQPGTYKAVAVSLSNGNYILPKDQVTKEYTIKENGGSGNNDTDKGPGTADGSGTDNGATNGSREIGKTVTETSDRTAAVFAVAAILLSASAVALIVLILRGKRRTKDKVKK